jgi:hypothetical protein
MSLSTSLFVLKVSLSSALFMLPGIVFASKNLLTTGPW